jgi:1-acyl-sn-glycerol-3-phosphate acyltransferase
MRYTIFDIPILRNLLQILSIVVLRIFGWRRSGQLPNIPKFVVIAAPHTSNWDFPIGLAIVFAFKMKMNWLGKDSLFRWPFCGFFKWLGGIPISRSKSGDVVAQTIQAFKEKAKMVIVVTPEGTRKKVKYWKTGSIASLRAPTSPLQWVSSIMCERWEVSAQRSCLPETLSPTWKRFGPSMTMSQVRFLRNQLRQ